MFKFLRITWMLPWRAGTSCPRHIVQLSSLNYRAKSSVIFPDQGKVSNRLASTVEANAETVVATSEKENLPSGSLPQHLVDPLFRVLSNLGVTMDNLNDALKVSPELLEYAPRKWENFFSILISYGFSSLDCLKMVSMYPPLLSRTVEETEQSMDYWRYSKISSGNLVYILSGSPHLLCVDESVIVQRVSALQAVYPIRQVLKIIRNSPKIMFENWQQVEAKFAYVNDVMNVPLKEISNSCVFNHSLQFIKTRHLFLERAGLYKKPEEKENIKINPPLNSIVDTSDVDFCKNVAKMTLEEYEVFTSLLEAEDDDAESDDSDSDAESGINSYKKHFTKRSK